MLGGSAILWCRDASACVAWSLSLALLCRASGSTHVHVCTCVLHLQLRSPLLPRLPGKRPHAASSYLPHATGRQRHSGVVWRGVARCVRAIKVTGGCAHRASMPRGCRAQPFAKGSRASLPTSSSLPLTRPSRCMPPLPSLQKGTNHQEPASALLPAVFFKIRRRAARAADGALCSGWHAQADLRLRVLVWLGCGGGACLATPSDLNEALVPRPPPGRRQHATSHLRPHPGVLATAVWGCR